MECPYCNNKMILGNICARGGGGMYWLPEDEKINFYETISEKTIEKHNGTILVINEIGTIKYEAYICNSCKKIMLEY